MFDHVLSAVNEVAENDSSILTTPLSKTDSITSHFRQFCKVSACVRPHEMHIIVYYTKQKIPTGRIIIKTGLVEAVNSWTPFYRTFLSVIKK